MLTLDPRLTRGADVRVVIEAKDRAMSQRAMREELREARENRGATVAIAAWTPAHAPSGVAPFAMVGDDVHVVVDPEAPDGAYLEAAVRLARLLAFAQLKEREVDVDAAADRPGPRRGPGAAGCHPVAQDAADVGVERGEGGLDRPGHPADGHPRPGRGGGGGAQADAGTRRRPDRTSASPDHRP